MLRFAERVVLEDAEIVAELHDDLRYCLKYGELVEYRDGRRRVRGRWSAYEFRSVEQLRYDFERDIRELRARAAGGRLG